MFQRNSFVVAAAIGLSWLIFSGAACTKKEPSLVRGGNFGHAPKKGTVEQQNLELKNIERAASEAHSKMFVEAWSLLNDKPSVELPSPFSLIEKAAKETLKRIENNEVIDCKQEHGKSVYWEIAGESPRRLLRQHICEVGNEYFRVYGEIQNTGKLSYKWAWKTRMLSEELGDAFVKFAKDQMLCEMSIAGDGIIEKMKCHDLGRSIDDSDIYWQITLWDYNRSVKKVLNVRGQKKKGSQNLDKEKSVEVFPDQVVVTTRLEDEEEQIAPLQLVSEVEAPSPQPGNPQPNAARTDFELEASDRAKEVAAMTPDQVELEKEMDKVIAENCSEKEVALLKTMVKTKAEIADSCREGQIVQQEPTTEELAQAPSVR